MINIWPILYVSQCQCGAPYHAGESLGTLSLAAACHPQRGVLLGLAWGPEHPQGMALLAVPQMERGAGGGGLSVCLLGWDVRGVGLWCTH